MNRHLLISNHSMCNLHLSLDTQDGKHWNMQTNPPRGQNKVFLLWDNIAGQLGHHVTPGLLLTASLALPKVDLEDQFPSLLWWSPHLLFTQSPQGKSKYQIIWKGCFLMQYLQQHRLACVVSITGSMTRNTLGACSRKLCVGITPTCGIIKVLLLCRSKSWVYIKLWTCLLIYMCAIKSKWH